MSIKKTGIRALAAFFLITATAHTAPAGISAHSPDAGRTVRVGILSKPLRLLREGEIAPIVLIFPEGTRLEDESGRGSAAVRKASPVPSSGGWSLATDAGVFEGRFSLVMDTPGADRSFEVRVGNERRRYPLPLAIRSGAGDLELIITESLSRYALDAARAEYGPVPAHAEEALYALALLIEARFDGRGRAHNGYDACDLAHCVVYRGLTGAAGDKPEWSVDPRSLPCGAHFHAACGGRTLGERVFGRAGASCAGVRDRLVETGTALCGAEAWTARIGDAELASILSARNAPARSGLSIRIDDHTRRVSLRSGGELLAFPAEDFRLRVNRRKGWNFLKSNDYRVETVSEEGESVFVFTGIGNGHGAGLCQRGAVELARRGFSRYEILAHYYPGVRFGPTVEKADGTPPGVSYVLFDPETDAIAGASHPAFVNRELPAGSILKLIVALYCAAERPDLFDAYRYRCAGRAGAPLPDRCWTPDGHGETGIERALSHSCNLYFASLHSEISGESFRRFLDSLAGARVRVSLPPVSGPDGFARLLAGLDYRVRFTVRDGIALARLLAPGGREDPRLRLSPERRDIITRALYETMISGTAGNGTAESPAAHHDPCGLPWGKTATVLSGSNRLTGYGLFLGGKGGRGVFIALRGGTGAKAARLAPGLLGRTEKAPAEKK